MLNTATLNVASSRIINNQAEGGAGGAGIGGGISSDGGSLALSNSLLTGNLARGRRHQRPGGWRWHRRRCGSRE